MLFRIGDDVLLNMIIGGKNVLIRRKFDLICSLIINVYYKL